MSTNSCFITSASPTLPYFRRRQWGFLPERSAQSALLSVTHSRFQRMAMKSAASFSSWTKHLTAFLNHSVLPQKLSDIGVDPYIIQWIHNNIASSADLSMILCGWQRTILYAAIGFRCPTGLDARPLLFLVFINEVVDQVSVDSDDILLAIVQMYQVTSSLLTTYWRLQLWLFGFTKDFFPTAFHN